METLSNYIWILIVLFLIWICYQLWKAGKYRDPGQENTYFDAMKKREPFGCPYDIETKSCNYYNNITDRLDINQYKNSCEVCARYNNGDRPNKL